MKLGTPILSSTTSSLPEVAGDAALLVDPYNPGAIAKALSVLDSDAILRTRLAEAGLRQAEAFTAARYSERLAVLYQNTLAPVRA